MTYEETKFNTTRYNERGLRICPKCRSYENTQRHQDICQNGLPYYDYVVRDGAETHMKVLS